MKTTKDLDRLHSSDFYGIIADVERDLFFLSNSDSRMSQVRFGVCSHQGRRRRHTETNFDLFLTTGEDTSHPEKIF